jgi:hypothetical protein
LDCSTNWTGGSQRVKLPLYLLSSSLIHLLPAWAKPLGPGFEKFDGKARFETTHPLQVQPSSKTLQMKKTKKKKKPRGWEALPSVKSAGPSNTLTMNKQSI